MAAAITARSGAGSVVKAKTAVHIEVTGAEPNVGNTPATSISGNTVANPTVVTSPAHGLTTGDHIKITGSNSTPTLNSADRTVTVTGVNTFTVPVNVTIAGTAGTIERIADIDEAVGTEKRYYLLVDAPGGVDDARSHVFQTSSDGKHTWDDYIFPAAGSYTIRLRDMLTDTDVATLAVTVDAS